MSKDDYQDGFQAGIEYITDYLLELIDNSDDTPEVLVTKLLDFLENG